MGLTRSSAHTRRECKTCGALWFDRIGTTCRCDDKGPVERVYIAADALTTDDIAEIAGWTETLELGRIGTKAAGVVLAEAVDYLTLDVA